jgi:misacylated tRNA(Ala) deacylase
MKPNEGRLQTAEHILAHILEATVSDAKVVIAKFAEDSGLLEISSVQDLRKLDKLKLQAEVNEVADKKLPVRKYLKSRAEAEGEFDLSRLPVSVREIRVVEIEGYDKTTCKDPHVEDTSEIGKFTLQDVARVGKDRYRFVFQVD